MKSSTTTNSIGLNKYSDDQSDVVMHDFKSVMTESGSPTSKLNFNA